MPLLALAACSPAWDWREVRPPDSGVSLLMPCKPSSQQRKVSVAGQSLKLSLYVCTTGDQSWSLAFADVGDPTAVSPVLMALLQSARDNIGAASAPAQVWAVRGSTPNAGNLRVSLQGQLPGGKAIQLQTAVATRGTRVVQLSALAPQLPTEAAQTFLDSVNLGD